MSKRKCVVCGTDPALGYASIFHNGIEDWYCHPDEGPSCYIARPISDPTPRPIEGDK